MTRAPDVKSGSRALFRCALLAASLSVATSVSSAGGGLTEGTATTGSAGAASSSTPDAGSSDVTSSGFARAGVAKSKPSTLRCVNWADQRDNFVNGPLEPSGLDSNTDTYKTVRTKATAILSGFGRVLKANAIRVPINEPTATSAWWTAYKGLIDAALAKHMRVIIGYWAFQNGKPASTPAFTAMWKVVVDEYGSNSLVFFDIHNEPYGFSTADWIDFAAGWIASFPSVPRGRIIVAGSGYDQNVAAVASNAQFDGCLFSFHVYTFSAANITTVAGWQNLISSSIGPYASRTIVSEWGAPMTTGVTYNAAGTGSIDQAYVAGTSNEIRSLGMGSCYWPGLRIGDWWSITTLKGTGAQAKLSLNNASGLGHIQSAWGF